ncbi:RagB/SusD family nutrient uptake outer membrane protein [Sphingobacterium anhuiense]|uniref:RagB/SusD family nutrient uptake outer membrane protein n=1 Tax=Sphingobacterium anhuiense TaxID=493780 RepID=A0ABW5YX17_9SPHI
MKTKNILSGILIASVMLISSCKKFLDVVPDNIATIQDAFVSKAMAERYLYTCYSYLPVDGDPTTNPAFLGGDEIWLYEGIDQNAIIDYRAWLIGRGEMGITNPVLNYWDGAYGGKDLYQGIRDCNIFLENITIPRDLNSFERDQWIAEVNFLKAYYHFYLFRMYGPIVLVKENLPISSTPEEVRVYRATVDETVDYIVETLDKAIPNLPDKVESPINDLGRITKPIALAIKARVLLLAASPLFNGNTEMASLMDNTGKQLFNQVEKKEKWTVAMNAAKEAILSAEASGSKLYDFLPTAGTGTLSDETRTLLSIQGAITEKWNPEIIWGLTNSNTSTLQDASMARVVNNYSILSCISPTMKMTELFYSKNGVPIKEDKTYPFADRFAYRVGEVDHKYYVKEGQSTIQLHFDREPRFYADMGFDRGIWYGLGKYEDGTVNTNYVKARFKETAGKTNIRNFSATGYWPKKLVNYLNTMYEGSDYSIQRYTWPNVRLADLYLMFAEASNEANGPGDDALVYLDKVRTRAGLKGVKESWTNYSSNPNKPATKEGLRDIIRQERLIEMAFEGSRFWDLRRWKTAPEVMSQTIKGWDINQESMEGFYRERVLFTPRFEIKDYFWPIMDNNILVNKNLVQNLGW